MQTETILDKHYPLFDEISYTWDFLQERLSQPFFLEHPFELHLFRHGETTSNAQNLVTGSADVSLTEKGKLQALALGQKLEPHYDLALYSHLKRSWETLALALSGSEIEVDLFAIDSRLNERSLGELELKPSQPLAAYAEGDLTFAPNGGDTYLEVTRKILSFLWDLCQHQEAQPTQRVLLCGHMGPMRAILGIFRGLTTAREMLAQSFANTQIHRIVVDRLEFPRFAEESLARVEEITLSLPEKHREFFAFGRRELHLQR